jgi:hypothetical protein
MPRFPYLKKDNEEIDTEREEELEEIERDKPKEKAPKKELHLITGNGKTKKQEISDYYTGHKSKDLLVHVMQKGIEVDKPIKTKIYNQSVEWNRRQWPIISSRFVTDYNGVNHQYVDVNDVSVLTWQKDHEDNCKKCGGKMTVDSRESRALGRRGVFQAIWGLDNTHIILMIVLLIGAMGMAGAFMWAFNDNTKHQAELESAKTEIKRLNVVVETYHNVTGIVIGK